MFVLVWQSSGRECEIWPRGYKRFTCSTQLSMTFIMLINVKMTTIVGILTFISMKNTTSENSETKKNIFRHFSLYKEFEFHAPLS